METFLIPVIAVGGFAGLTLVGALIFMVILKFTGKKGSKGEVLPQHRGAQIQPVNVRPGDQLHAPPPTSASLGVAPPPAYGAPPQAYGAPHQAYGAPPQAYGAPPQAYGAPGQYPPPAQRYPPPTDAAYPPPQVGFSYS